MDEMTWRQWPHATTLSRRSLLLAAAGAQLASGFARPDLGATALPRANRGEQPRSTFGTRADDPLPSWNHGTSRLAILDFVTAATEEGDSQFVPPAERIATFDQDGTLWIEHPTYTQAFFALDRIEALVGYAAISW